MSDNEGLNSLSGQGAKPVDPKQSQAMRHNTGKPQLSMIPLHLLKPCADVLQWACTEKLNPYPRNNWRKGMPISKILDSLLRHIADLQEGKVIDDESGKPIIGHIQCNALFLNNPNNIDDITDNE